MADVKILKWLSRENIILVSGFLLQGPFSILMKLFTPKQAKFINFLLGITIVSTYLEYSEFLMWVLFLLINYALLKWILTSKTLYAYWIVIAFNFLTYITVYIIQAEFKFDIYSYGRLTFVIFIMIPRTTHLAVHAYDGSQEVLEITLLGYAEFTVGLMGFINAALFDIKNFKNVFDKNERGWKKQKYVTKYVVRSLIFASLHFSLNKFDTSLKEIKFINILDRFCCLLTGLKGYCFLLSCYSYTLACLLNIGFDPALFFGHFDPEKVYNWKLGSSIKNIIDNWNLFVVKWLQEMYRGKVNKKVYPILVLLTSSLWHGPTLGDILSYAILFSLFVINKKWFKLRSSKKSLKFLDSVVDSNFYYFLMLTISIMSIFTSTMPMLVHNKDIIFKNFEKMNYWPLWLLPNIYFMLNIADHILV